jgi:Zn-dependent protease
MEAAALVCAIWIVAVCLHEWGHAIVAYMGGDTSVKDKGYLTLNIFKYTDPGMSLFIPMFALMMGGIALPGAAVYIDHSKLRSKVWESAVSLAGPAMSALTLVLLVLPFYLGIAPRTPEGWLWPSIAFASQLLAFVTVLNLIPLPPLDGYGLIEPWLPTPLREKLRQFSVYGIWILLAALWFIDPIGDALWSISDSIITYFHVPLRMVGAGAVMFQRNSMVLVVVILVILAMVARRGQKKVPKEVEWYELGNHLQAERKYKEAIAAYDKALAIAPTLCDAWHNRALANAMMGNHEQAIADFKYAIDCAPNNANYWYNRACCFAMLDNKAEAYKHLEQAIKLDPTITESPEKLQAGFRDMLKDEQFVRLISNR